MTDIRWVRIVDVEYTTESDGYKQTTPIIHLFGRDTDWERHHIKVDRFRPYFVVRQSEWAEKGQRLLFWNLIADGVIGVLLLVVLWMQVFVL